MSVPQRMQYFPFGGGGIGPTAPGTTAIGAAYAPGGVTGTYMGGAARAGPPSGTTGVAVGPAGTAGPGGEAGASTCGSV